MKAWELQLATRCRFIFCFIFCAWLAASTFMISKSKFGIVFMTCFSWCIQYKLNESIGVFQVSHQSSFSNWAWTECVTCVKGFISHYLCTELQNSVNQHSLRKPEQESLLAFTRQGFGIPEAIFPHWLYAKLMCSDSQMKSVKDLSTAAAQHKHSPHRDEGRRVCSGLPSLRNS